MTKKCRVSEFKRDNIFMNFYRWYFRIDSFRMWNLIIRWPHDPGWEDHIGMDNLGKYNIQHLLEWGISDPYVRCRHVLK